MNTTPEYQEQWTDAVRTRDAIQALVASKGWELIEEWLNHNITTLRGEYEKSGPITTGNMYANEFRRAQLTMLHSLLDLPGRLLQDSEDAIEAMKLAEGDDNATEE